MPEREKETVFVPPAPGSAMDKYIQKKVEEAAMAAATAVVRNQTVPSAILDTVSPWIPSELRSVGNLAGTGTKFLQLPSGYVTAVWGPGGGGINYDKIYVGGRTYTPGAKTTNFLKVNADGSSSWVASITDPMPTGSEVYDVTKNHIHLPGETAGNI